ncbi:unnamed protein product [Rotaria socialis]|uniref:Uncharacterized protein n=1 Tax=Rotaria socialis TaxID=392032 RepID=A0A820IYF7_9BILA|nr:unnamed protein product [Rotaria socialis]
METLKNDIKEGRVPMREATTRMIFNLNNIVIHYITEEDFRDIAAANMNTVRIPVGYWIIGFDNQPGGDPDGWKVYAPGAVNYSGVKNYRLTLLLCPLSLFFLY